MSQVLIVTDPSVVADPSWTDLGAALPTDPTLVDAYAGVFPDGRVWRSDGNDLKVFDPDTNAWSSLANPPRPTSNAVDGRCMVQLADGRLLIVGGFDSVTFDEFTNAAIYDPTSNTWSATDPLPTPNDSMSAVLLPDGRVLVTCLEDYTTPPFAGLHTSYLFDPATETWRASAPNLHASVQAQLVVLDDGRVLKVGGELDYSNTGGSNTSEIYNPATNTWIDAGAMAHGYGGSAVRVPGGDVVVFGARDPATSTNFDEIQRWDHVGLSWTTLAAVLSSARVTIQAAEQRNAVLLPSNQVLVGPGLAASRAFSVKTDLFDPAFNTIAALPDAGGTGLGDCSVQANGGLQLLENGQVLLLPGSDDARDPANKTTVFEEGVQVIQPDLHYPGRDPMVPDLVIPEFLADPGATARVYVGEEDAQRVAVVAVGVAAGKHFRTIIQKFHTIFSQYVQPARPAPAPPPPPPPFHNLVWTPIANMAQGRWFHTGVKTAAGDLLVPSGLDDFNQVVNFTSLFAANGSGVVEQGAQPVGVFAYGAALLGDNRVLVAGGAIQKGFLGDVATPASATWDPNTGNWTAQPDISLGRHRAVCLAIPGGDALLMGGGQLDADPKSAIIERYSTGANTWAVKTPLNVARDSAAAAVLQDGTVLTTGGFAVGGVGIVSCEVYDPVGNTSTNVANMNHARAAHQLVVLADGTVLAIGGKDALANWVSTCEVYDPIGNTWTDVGSMVVVRANFHAFLMDNGHVTALGGDSAPDSINNVDDYDPVTKVWTPNTPLLQADSFFSAMYEGGFVFFYAGGIDETFTLITGGGISS